VKEFKTEYIASSIGTTNIRNNATVFYGFVGQNNFESYDGVRNNAAPTRYI